MLVEDDHSLRANMKLLFESEGYTVSVAENGQVAVDQLLSGQDLPSLIVLDLMMPIMDGFEFREAQRTIPRLAEIPVVIMTADGRVYEKQLRTSAVHALRKPADIDEILQAVEKYGRWSA